MSAPPKKPRKRGPPKAGQTVVNLYLDPAMLEEVESWRFSHRYPTRQAAIREILRKGMAAK
jgi:hypothetical protein